MDSSPRLRILACGGTFDKRYNPISGALEFNTSQLPGIVAQSRVTLPIVVETVMLIDSLDMKAADRERVLAACRRAPETALVVVHGTDTMPETGQALGPHFGARPVERDGAAPSTDATHDASKTIVLTGAMVPYAIACSDALFNLGFACACAQTLPAGVWIAMNGRIFAWNRVRKNREDGVFEATH